MEDIEERHDFRDRTSTIASDGKRLWVYPKKPSGKLYNYRQIVALVLLAIFFIMPFIKVNGDPLLLLNFIDRQFIIFGMIFYPQDFYLFVLSMIAFIVFVVLFTVIFGRIFCGWICPQTIFMEFIFRRIEYLIEGSNVKQRKLDNKSLDFEKFWRKGLKHVVFYMISLITTTFFLAYIFGMDQVRVWVSEGPLARPAAFTGVLIFAGIHYLVFAKLREQVCVIICPYGRLQGVLLDRNSILVSYDYMRGEPRGLGKNREGKGDCIDCKSCVMVCPTGIDIRNGTQLECINCTACIDACRPIMKRMNKPEGLIRYASENSISQGQKLKFNVRVVFYSVILAGLLILIAFLMSQRTAIESSILRLSGSMYQEYDAQHWSNIYTIQVVNKTRETLPVGIKLTNPAGTIKMMGDSLIVGRGEVRKANFLVVIPKTEIKTSTTPVSFQVMSEEREMNSIESTFVGPNALDKK